MLSRFSKSFGKNPFISRKVQIETLRLMKGLFKKRFAKRDNISALFETFYSDASVPFEVT